MEVQMIRVLVVDDHPQLRRAVVEVLSDRKDMTIVGQASDGAMAVELARALRPHVVIMDLHMPGVDGLQATSVLNTELPNIRVLMYTVSESEADLFAALRFGARGYILKSTTPQELADAVLYVARGAVTIAPSMATKLLTDRAHLRLPETQSETSSEELTPQEEAVLKLVARCATNSEIGHTLARSETRVMEHLQSIMVKLHLANRSQAAAYAWKSGLQRPME